MGHTFNRPDEAAMLRILERHPHSPEGAILRLAWLEGLSRSEITELRWDQVDFEGKAIQLPDRAVPAGTLHGSLPPGAARPLCPPGTPMW